MGGPERKRPDWGPAGKMATDAGQAALGEVIDDAAEGMLRSAPKATRFVLKRVPGAPGLLVDVVELTQAKGLNAKFRKGASMVGAGLGGAAGGALGAATGPGAVVAAPIGAAVGSVAGQHIAEDLFDDYAGDVEGKLRRGAGSMKQWLKGREADLARGAADRMRPYLPPGALR